MWGWCFSYPNLGPQTCFLIPVGHLAHECLIWTFKLIASWRHDKNDPQAWTCLSFHQNRSQLKPWCYFWSMRPIPRRHGLARYWRRTLQVNGRFPGRKFRWRLMRDTHRLKRETTHSEWLASSKPLQLPLFPVADSSGGYNGNWYSCCSQGSKIWLMEKNICWSNWIAIKGSTINYQTWNHYSWRSKFEGQTSQMVQDFFKFHELFIFSAKRLTDVLVSSNGLEAYCQPETPESWRRRRTFTLAPNEMQARRLGSGEEKIKFNDDMIWLADSHLRDHWTNENIRDSSHGLWKADKHI